MKKFWRVFRTAFSSLMIVLLLLLLSYNIFVSAAHASGQALPKVFGWSTAVIISGSMSGAIEVDDVVIARAQDEYEVGDVVLYRDEHGTTICHRIAERDGAFFVTKGDANNVVDQRPVPQSDIYGKVRVIIRHIGAVQRVLHTSAGTMTLALLTVILILWPYFRRKKQAEV
ncbi:MAG: signal peptidase I [Oscillospiraceae bacterium]|jgi:signal peptidase|nr:signal peptidase I [Oscillospiraceae bacterium]